ncbi:hypothetical protein ACLOJK_015078 [Asimina triloba]
MTRRRATFSSRANLAINFDEANCFVVVPGKAWIGRSRPSIAHAACRCTTPSIAIAAIHRACTATAIITLVATSLLATTSSAINEVNHPCYRLPVHATPANCPLHVGSNIDNIGVGVA